VIVDLDAYGDLTCAVTEAGELWCWGDGGHDIVGREGEGPWDLAKVALPKGLVRVELGEYHACALDGAGKLYCWGASGNSRLGRPESEGNLAPSPSLPAVAGLPAVVDFDVAEAHGCAADAKGAVWCWGVNYDGEASGDGSEVRTPRKVAGISGAVDVSVGGGNGCAVTGAGEVWCWGTSRYGQLGMQDAEEPGHRREPVRIGVKGATRVSVGDGGACAVTKTGLACWGRVDAGADPERGIEPALLRGTKGTAIAVSSWMCAVDGAVACEGWGAARFLDDGKWDPGDRAVISGTEGASEVVLGSEHGCALVGGGVVCWGEASRGQLADGTRERRAEASPVAGLADVVALEAGSEHTCALRRDGEVHCWGANDSGQLGDGTTLDRAAPVRVATSVAAIAADARRTCILGSDGAVRCWGDEPSEAKGFAKPTSLCVSGSHVCVAEKGGLACWGYDYGGELGPGGGSDHRAADAPLRTPGYASAICGSGRTCGLSPTGQLSCWGRGDGGLLGTGRPDEERAAPARVVGLDVVRAVDLGDRRTCAVAGGEAYCWGDGARTPVLGLRATDVATEGWAVCFVTDGAVSCADPDGSSGPGQPDLDPWRFSVVNGTAGAASVALGEEHGCALLAGGTVACWGDATRGRLGDGVGTFRVTPVRVPLP
jgi:alpha-tubulin suppressor-like RCC1 family protein